MPASRHLNVLDRPAVDLYAHPPVRAPAGYVPDQAIPPISLHEIDLYVTMRCNLRCEFCSVRAGEYRHEDLPLARIIELIDEAVPLGLRELHFLGGEPTLRRDLEDMIAHAAKAGVATRIITNGMLLPRARIQRMIELGLGEVMISVDGLASAHSKLRRCDEQDWHTTMQCVRDCVAEGIRTRVSMVAYRHNYDDVIPLLEQVEAMGVNCFSVFLGSPLGRGHDMIDQVIDPWSWRALQDAVGRRSASMRSNFDLIMEQGFAWVDRPKIDRSALRGRGTGCNTLLESYDYLIVRSDGRLYQCVFFMTEGRPIGTIVDQPLETALQFALERAEYRDFTVAQDRCTGCSVQGDCGTGCRGYAYLYEGDWLRTDPRCAKLGAADPEAQQQLQPPLYPLCPILKANVRTGGFGGSSEDALRAGRRELDKT